MKRSATAVLLLSLGALGGCTGSDSTATPSRPVAMVIRWHGQAVRPPFRADGRAIVVEPGGGPTGVTREQARSIAHALLHDTPSGQREVPGCAGCTSPTARIAFVVSGRVTLSTAVRRSEGERRGLHDRPAWVVAYQPPRAMGCPVVPGGRPEPSATASGLDAVIVTGTGSTDVLAYHGAGTGSCAPRLHPEVTASVSSGIDPGDADS